MTESEDKAGSATSVSASARLSATVSTDAQLARLVSANEQIIAHLDQISRRLEVAERKLQEIGSVVGPFGVPMPDGTMLVQTIYGVKYLIDSLDIIMAPNLIVYRQWEADLSSYFWQTLKPHHVFVDVGANFGYFACLAGSKIGRLGAGRVFAIEPNPASYRLLEKNIRINWSMSPVTLFKTAVGAAAGRAVLSVPSGRAANASLSAMPNVDVPTETFEVEMRMIDQIVPAGIAVDFMKIDVEGHEHSALMGAKAIIARSPRIRIVMEWSQPQMRDAGVSNEEMFRLFSELGLCAVRIESLRGANEAAFAKPLTNAELAAIPYDNIVLAPRKGFG